jgi:hypothetical protein
MQINARERPFPLNSKIKHRIASCKTNKANHKILKINSFGVVGKHNSFPMLISSISRRRPPRPQRISVRRRRHRSAENDPTSRHGPSGMTRTLSQGPFFIRHGTLPIESSRKDTRRGHSSLRPRRSGRDGGRHTPHGVRARSRSRGFIRKRPRGSRKRRASFRLRIAAPSALTGTTLTSPSCGHKACDPALALGRWHHQETDPVAAAELVRFDVAHPQLAGGEVATGDAQGPVGESFDLQGADPAGADGGSVKDAVAADGCRWHGGRRDVVRVVG